VRVGIRVPPCASVREIADFAVDAERAGLDEVWLPDSQLLWRDVFAVAAGVAAATSRITLGTAVTNLVTRHPAVIASAARTVAELAPGRFVLGVGVGNSSVGPIGLRPSTGAQLRSRLSVVRDLLAGKRVDFGEVVTGLRDPVAVPIHMAASGPRNLRLAGEIADGVILLSGVAPEPLAAAIGAVRAGGDRPITVSAFCRVTDDLARDARELKPVCLGIAYRGGAPFLAKAGVEVEVPEQLPASYPDLLHAEDWAAAVRACDPFVSDRAVEVFAREFCLYGTAGQIAARLREVERAGAEAVFLQHVGSYDLPRQLLADVAGRVLPATQSSSAGLVNRPGHVLG
jgi:5,10-methylenetetrahydromethanopterin reductase